MKKSLLLIAVSICLLPSYILHAQNNRQWGTYYGGSGADFGYAVATDNNGNVYVAGMTNDNDASVFFSGGFQNTYGGGTNDAYLVKFDSNGNRLWSTYYGGSGNDQGYAVTTNSNGDVYLAGFTTSINGISTLGSHQPAFGGGTYDAFVVKFDASGTRLWGTYYGGTNSSYGQTLVTDPLGNLYFGGYTSDTQVGSIATPGAHQTVNGGGNYDAFLVMFDSGGNRIWGTYYGGAGSEGVFPPATVPSTNVSLALDKAGAIYLGGFTSSAAGIATPGAFQTVNAGGAFDGFVAKFTPMGTRVWGTYFGDNQQDEVRSVAVHGANLYLSGRTASNNNIATVGSYQDFYGGGTYDAFLARFDTSGAEIWSTYYGEAGQEWGLAVTTDAMGNIYQAGRSGSTVNIASPDGFQTIMGGTVDNYVVKFDTSGFRYCATYLGGTGTDISYGAAISNGKIFMTGQTTSAGGIAAGGYDNTYGGNTDAFLAKFTSCIYTTMSQSDPLCGGICDGTATANPSFGATLLPYSYMWNPGGQTTQTATGLCAGSYTVVVSDANGNTTTDFVTINEPPVLTTTVSTLPATCGNNDGGAGVTVSGGTPGYAYSWAPGGETTQFVTGLSAGVYTVTVTDANNCTIVSTGTVTSSGPSVAISSSTNVSCNGGNNGSANATVTGGTPVYTYAWSPSGGTTSAATGLTAQDYTVLVTDGAGCTATATVSITEPTAFTGSVTTNGATCGNNNGSATLNASGGTLPYTYSWNPTGQTTATATGLAAGNYTVTGTDANGCTQVHAAVITSSGGVSVGIFSQTNVSCNGGSDGAATPSISSGTFPFTYSWSTSPVQTTLTATGLSAAIYTITITDANSCTGSTTVSITEPTAITATVSTTNTTCGGNNGSATVNASGGTGSYTYSWNPTGQTTSTATGLGVGTYSVLITDANNCTQSGVGTVNPINGPTVTISAQTNVSCFGGNNGSATASASGGSLPYTYGWTTTPFQFTPTATGLTAGTYTIVVSDALSCTGTAIVTITEPTAITASVVTTNTTCGNNNGTATANVSGGVPGYTYSWSTLPVQTTATATGLATGGYMVTITDANGCMTSAAGTVNATSTPTVSIASQTNVSCNGGNDGTATASTSGGTSPYTYLWNPTGQTTATATGLSMGNYFVSVTDVNGCNNTATVSISEPTAISTTVSTTNSSCSMSTGSATVNASGGTPSYTYFWTSSPVQTTATATGLAAGSYTVTVTDANGCVMNAFANVINSNGPTVSIASQTNVTCNGGNDGSAVSSASGGTPPYTYSWNPTGQTTITATGLSAGTYSVTVTDASGCTSVASTTISEPAALSVSVTNTPATCGSNNGSACASVSGGVAPYTYSWSPVAGSTSCISGLAAGNYSVTITDANGCTNVSSVTIISSGAPVVSLFSQTNVSCNGGNDGSATVSVSGGTIPYTYSWSTSPAQIAATATGLTAGSYTVTVTDASGCTGTTAVTITQPTGMSVSISNTSATCGNNDGSATATVSNGASPYTYNWSSGQTTAAANNLTAGSYTVTITDANGCTTTSSTMIINSNGPTASILSQTNASCFGASDGSATATATGATPPYTYSWNTTPVQNSQTATGLSAGMYTVTVTDAGGCLSIAIVAITEPVAIAVSATSLSNASCGTCCDGTASSSVSGGTSPYTYLWSNGQTNVTATGLCASAIYTVCITDANGCSSCDTVLIPFSSPVGISQLSIDNYQLSIYPNPANEYLFVEGTVSSSEKIEVDVVNLFGQSIMRNYFDVSRKFSEKINTENLPAGIYFIEINSSHFTQKLKIVIR